MSAPVRPVATAAAALAVLACAATFVPMFADRGWWGPSVAVVTIVALVGVVVRGVGGPWFVTPLVQLGALAVYVTARFAPEHAPLGLVPTRAAGKELGRVVDVGLTDIDQLVIPVPSTEGITLVACLGVAAVAVLVDTCAAGLRRPVLAGLPLLVLYAVPAAVLADGLGPGWFAVAAAGWLVLLAVVRPDEVEKWDGTRSTRREDGRAVHRVTARRAVQGGAGAVLLAVLVAAVVPGVGDGAFRGVEQRRTGGGAGPDGTGQASGDTENARLDLSLVLNANLKSSNDVAVLGYRTQDGSPQYLRLAVVDSFDGATWLPVEPDDDAPSTGAARVDVPGLDVDRVPTRELRTEITPFGTAQHLSFLPAPYMPTSTDLQGVWRWDRTTSTAFSRRSALGDRPYTVFSTQAQPSGADLSGRSASNLPDHLRLPTGVPADLPRLANEVTAASVGPYEQAIALQDWFRSEFAYDVTAPDPDSAEVLDAFLRDRRGYCQHFAATFTLMARSLGIPARVAIGFTPGTPASVWAQRPGGFLGAGAPLPAELDLDGTFVVSTQDYHAWPEVWFDGVGWLRFEPTPRADGTVESPAWAPASELPAQPRPVPTDIEPSGEPNAPPPGAPSSPGLGTTADDAGWLSVGRAGGATLLVLVAVALCGAPGAARLLRRRRRARQIEQAHEVAAAEAVEAAWAELADTARDLGVAWPHEDSPRRSARTLHATDGLRTDQAAVGALRLLTEDVERVRYSAEPRTDGRVGQHLRTVRGALLDAAGPGGRLRAALLPRSILSRRGGQ